MNHGVMKRAELVTIVAAVLVVGLLFVGIKLSGNSSKPPAAESPVAESPVAKSPVAESPVAESPVAESPVAKSPVAESPVDEKVKFDYKLKHIIIPVVDFDDTSVEEAIDFLRQRARVLDTFELDPNKKGINFVIRKPRLSGAAGIDAELDGEGGLGAIDPGTARVKDLKLRNVPLALVLEFICYQARLRYQIDEFAVTLLPIGSTERGKQVKPNSQGKVSIKFKLMNMIIPVVDFEYATVGEAIDFIRQRSSELDKWETDPTRKGINFVIRAGAAEKPVKKLKVRNVSAHYVLAYICQSTGLRFEIDDVTDMVILMPAGR